VSCRSTTRFFGALACAVRNVFERGREDRHRVAQSRVVMSWRISRRRSGAPCRPCSSCAA